MTATSERARLAAFLEVCHHGPASPAAWVAAVAGPLSSLMSDGGAWVGVMDRERQSLVQLHSHTREACPFEVGDYPPQWLLPATLRTGARMKKVLRRAHEPFRVTRMSTFFGPLLASLAHAPEALLTGPLARWSDAGGVEAHAGTLLLLALAPLDVGSDFDARRRRLLRIQRHLLGAFERRGSYGWEKGTALVVGADGKAHHASAGAGAWRLHAADLARAMASDAKLPAEPDERAELLWDSLWARGFSVAASEEADGRRYVVVRRRVAPRPQLTNRERGVVGGLVRGAGLKAIAHDLGTTVQTVSVQARSALAKLGLRDVTELVALTGTAHSSPAQDD